MTVTANNLIIDFRTYLALVLLQVKYINHGLLTKDTAGQILNRVVYGVLADKGLNYATKDEIYVDEKEYLIKYFLGKRSEFDLNYDYVEKEIKELENKVEDLILWIKSNPKGNYSEDYLRIRDYFIYELPVRPDTANLIASAITYSPAYYLSDKKEKVVKGYYSGYMSGRILSCKYYDDFVNRDYKLYLKGDNSKRIELILDNKFSKELYEAANSNERYKIRVFYDNCRAGALNTYRLLFSGFYVTPLNSKLIRIRQPKIMILNAEYYSNESTENLKVIWDVK